MKKFITFLLALGVGLSVMAPVSSQARDSGAQYWKHCEYCGGAIYRRHIVIDRTSHGKAVKSWQVLPHRCNAYSGPGYSYPAYGYGYPRGYQPGYHPGHHNPGYGRVSVPGFRFSFGR